MWWRPSRDLCGFLGVAASACVVGWCGGVPQVWAGFPSFWSKRRLDEVRLTVRVRCLGAVVCCGVAGCAVLCLAVERCAAPRCAALTPALPCRAVPCSVVASVAAPCCDVLRLAVPCHAVPCVPCFARSRGAEARGAALWCAVLRCAVLYCVVSCCPVPCCAVGQSHPLVRCGVVAALVRLAALLCGWRGCCAGSGYVAGWWLVGMDWRCAVRWVGAAGAWVCGPVQWVGRVSGGVALPLVLRPGHVPSVVPVPRGVPGSSGWGGVASSAWLVPLLSCFPAFVLSQTFVSQPCPLSSPGVRVLVSVCWPLQCRVAGVVAWRLGCGGGL